MSERVFKPVSKKHNKEVSEVPEEVQTSPNQEIVDDIDSILDQIDEVLETNADEFVKSYVQKGGQ
ncbi:MAG: ubiquitin-like protein Pup [bacterium]